MKGKSFRCFLTYQQGMTPLYSPCRPILSTVLWLFLIFLGSVDECLILVCDSVQSCDMPIQTLGVPLYISPSIHHAKYPTKKAPYARDLYGEMNDYLIQIRFLFGQFS